MCRNITGGEKIVELINQPTDWKNKFGNVCADRVRHYRPLRISRTAYCNT